MAWTPIYYNGGLFPNVPDGNLTVPVDNAREAGNVYTVGEGLYANYHSSDTFSEEYLPWANAKGKNFSDKLIGLLRAHIGDGPHTDILFANFDIKCPAHAPYYKQELCVWGSYEAGALQRVEDPETGAWLEYFQAIVAITKITRRQYDTPYSQPSSEDLIVDGVTSQFFYATGGKEFKWLEWLYNFYDDGIFAAGDAHWQNKYYFTLGFYTKSSRTYDRTEPDEITVDFVGFGLSIDFLEEHFGGDFEPEETEDPNEDPDEPGGGESEEGGGGGDHDDSEDEIPFPPLPPFGASDAGFVHMFKLTLSQMVGFATTMFTSNIWQAIKDFFSDPMDFIAGVLIVPFTPTGEDVRYPKFGSNIWPNAYPLVGSQFTIIDMGSLHVPKYYNSFLDYDAFTKIKIYLPYIGYKDLLADEVMDCTLQVKYYCDCGTGDCVAMIGVTDPKGRTQVCYQFQGNCAVRVPYGRQSFDAAVSSSLSLMGGVGSLAVGGAMLASGGLAGAAVGLGVAQIAGQVGSMTADAVAGQKRAMERAGALGASAGFMGIQYPYLIREIPNQSRPSNYRKLHGYPANLGGTLGSFTGYTAVESIRLDGIPCTDAEKSEIIELLRGGVIL